uniref:Uncharacterized protein n=1 Tax=Mycena chlorophos TaxID=658473 RepID=A0ABQ0L1W1_MYCCL|nr:predicted protein [Mycena chlorophos]
MPADRTSAAPLALRILERGRPATKPTVAPTHFSRDAELISSRSAEPEPAPLAASKRVGFLQRAVEYATHSLAFPAFVHLTLRRRMVATDESLITGSEDGRRNEV